jgi:hypothetical protein
MSLRAAWDRATAVDQRTSLVRLSVFVLVLMLSQLWRAFAPRTWLAGGDIAFDGILLPFIAVMAGAFWRSLPRQGNRV